MKISSFNQPLGMGRGAGMERDALAVSVPQQKLWIVSAISAGAGLATSLFGGMAASKAARAAERRQRAQEAEEQASYLRRKNEDYVDTAAGQNLVRRAKDIYNTSIKRAEGARAVAGGTDASVQMAKDAANKAVGDTIADIAANDIARKDAAEKDHQAATQRFAQMDMAREQQRAQAITDAAQGASNAIMAAGGAIEQASASPSLQGGSNNSIQKSVTQMDSDVGKFGQADINKVSHFGGNSVVPEGDYTEAQLRRLGL